MLVSEKLHARRRRCLRATRERGVRCTYRKEFSLHRDQLSRSIVPYVNAARAVVTDISHLVVIFVAVLVVVDLLGAVVWIYLKRSCPLSTELFSSLGGRSFRKVGRSATKFVARLGWGHSIWLPHVTLFRA